MPQTIATIALVVADYDGAIAFYCDRLGFVLIADSDMGLGKRWVVVGPADGRGARLLLAKADGERQRAAVGSQTGGRVGTLRRSLSAVCGSSKRRGTRLMAASLCSRTSTATSGI